MGILAGGWRRRRRLRQQRRRQGLRTRSRFRRRSEKWRQRRRNAGILGGKILGKSRGGPEDNLTPGQDYRVCRLSRTLSGRRRTKHFHFFRTLYTESSTLFHMTNARVLFKRTVQTFLFSEFSLDEDPLGVQWRFRGVEDSGENRVRSVFRGRLPARPGEPFCMWRLFTR